MRAFDLEAYRHQDVPFERVVEALQPARSLARQPLFQVMLALQNVPQENLVLPGLSVRPEPLDSDVAKFDLTLSLAETLGPGGEPLGIEGVLEYSADLFERATAEVLAARYAQVLAAAAAHPEVAVSRLDVFAPGERRMLLEAFNDTARAVPPATIAELFEAQAARDPDAVAVVFGEQQLSYGQLNACANRLAHHLIASGVQPDSLVGIGMDRSLEMVAALLGILKAGAAYAPIDPDLPAARRQRLVTDSGLRHIVTSRGHAALYEGCVAQVVTLEACGHQPDSNPASVALAARSAGVSQLHVRFDR